MKVTPPAPCSEASPSGVAQDGLQARAERFRVIFEKEAAERGLPSHGAALAGTGGLRRRGHLRPAGGQRTS